MDKSSFLSTSHLANLPAMMLLRKSRADEEEEKKARAEGRTLDVLKTHRAILCDLAQKDGATITYVCEEVLSGERLEDRPEFRRFLEHLRRLPRPGGVLYTIHAERVTRGLLSERGTVQDLLIQKRILIRDPGGWTNLEVADERLLFEVKGSLAHHYLLRYKERVALTRGQQVKEARVRNGSVCFGYEWDKEKKAPRPDPLEYPILQALCRDAFSLSTWQLAEKYGLPQTTVRTALTSPMICGWPARTTGYRPGTKKVVYLPREEWVWPEQEGSYEKAISREEWERLQAVMVGRRRGQGGRTLSENAWCRDVVRFAGCDKKPCLGTYHGFGGVYPVYEARPLYVAREAVHAAVVEALSSIEWERLRARVKDGALAPPERSDLSAITSEQERVRKQLARVNEELIDPDASDEDRLALRATRTRLNGDLDRLKKQAEALRSSVPAVTAAQTELLQELALHFLKSDFAAIWETVSEETKRLLTRLLVAVAEVVVEREKKPHRRTVTVRLSDWWRAD